MHRILLYIISIIHLLFVLFILIVPFTSSNYLLFVHSIVTPFMMIHWLLNDNTCALTLMEKFIRKEILKENVNDNECFTSRLINPIYDFASNNEQYAKFAYSVVTILWLISVYKIYKKIKVGEISSIFDLGKF